MSIWTLTNSIRTSRVFILSEQELKCVSRVLGDKPQGMLAGAKGYCQSYYNDLKMIGGNWNDDMEDLRPFYDLLRVKYGVEYSYPKQSPYLKYVDYIKSLGNGFRVDDKVIKHLRKRCNTLIISDKAEFDSLKAEFEKICEHAEAKKPSLLTRANSFYEKQR